MLQVQHYFRIVSLRCLFVGLMKAVGDIVPDIVAAAKSEPSAEAQAKAGLTSLMAMTCADSMRQHTLLCLHKSRCIDVLPSHAAVQYMYGALITCLDHVVDLCYISATVQQRCTSITYLHSVV